MKKITFVAILLSFGLSLCGIAKADFVSIFTSDQKDDYYQQAGPSEWAFGSIGEGEKTHAPFFNDFTLKNTLDQWRADDQKVGDRQGRYKVDLYNGKGAGYDQTMTGSGSEVGLQFGHNSANKASVFVPDGLIDSFYLNIDTHANESSTEKMFNITVNTTNGSKLFEEIGYGWVGFILDDGEYLINFEIEQVANKNTGFYFDFVPGDGTAMTPEPASMLIFGVAGLLGLPVARRLRKTAPVKA